MPLEGFHDLGFLDLHMPKLSSTDIATYVYKVKCHFSDLMACSFGLSICAHTDYSMHTWQ